MDEPDLRSESLGQACDLVHDLGSGAFRRVRRLRRVLPSQHLEQRLPGGEAGAPPRVERARAPDAMLQPEARQLLVMGAENVVVSADGGAHAATTRGAPPAFGSKRKAAQRPPFYYLLAECFLGGSKPFASNYGTRILPQCPRL